MQKKWDEEENEDVIRCWVEIIAHAKKLFYALNEFQSIENKTIKQTCQWMIDWRKL